VVCRVCWTRGDGDRIGRNGRVIGRKEYHYCWDTVDFFSVTFCLLVCVCVFVLFRIDRLVDDVCMCERGDCGQFCGVSWVDGRLKGVNIRHGDLGPLILDLSPFNPCDVACI
jgi:hypothetical protein